MGRLILPTLCESRSMVGHNTSNVNMGVEDHENQVVLEFLIKGCALMRNSWEIAPFKAEMPC